MRSPLQHLAVALVRIWTRVYTWRMDPLARDTRRAEIESDLWESMHDDEDRLRGGRAGHILARLFGGLLDDVRWRAEQPALDPQRLRITFAIAAVALLAFGAWIMFVAGPPPPPPPPPPPALIQDGVPPPPPPPPPPPK